MVFIDDNSLSGSSLSSSLADITITDGMKSIREELPVVQEDTVAGAKFWLAGCIGIIGDTFTYVPVNKFSRDSPSIVDKLLCDSLLRNTVATTTESSCENVILDITIHNSLTNNPVGNMSINVVKNTEESQITVLAGGLTNNAGKISTPVEGNGEYVVQVEGDGFIASSKSINVNCEISRYLFKSFQIVKLVRYELYMHHL